MTVTQSPRWKTGVLPETLTEQPHVPKSAAPIQDMPYLTPADKCPAQTLVAQRNLRSKRSLQDRLERLERTQFSLNASQRLRSHNSRQANLKCKSQVGDHLVDYATDLIVSTWPSDVVSREMVRHFIAEAVRRSCTSYALLQLAVYYATMARDWAQNRRKGDPHALDTCPTLGCGRRVFLAALVVAHKYHIDRSFGATAWSKISCLPAKQIVAMELDLLKALDWKVHIPYSKFAEWCQKTLVLPSMLVSKPDSEEVQIPMASIPQVQMLTPDNSPVS